MKHSDGLMKDFVYYNILIIKNYEALKDFLEKISSLMVLFDLTFIFLGKYSLSGRQNMGMFLLRSYHGMLRDGHRG